MTTRKAVTVNSNYHVAFGGAWYSVPFTYANKSVEVVATKDTVAVVADGQRIAMHQRVREVCFVKQIFRNSSSDSFGSQHRGFSDFTKGRGA